MFGILLAGAVGGIIGGSVNGGGIIEDLFGSEKTKLMDRIVEEIKKALPDAKSVSVTKLEVIAENNEYKQYNADVSVGFDIYADGKEIRQSVECTNIRILFSKDTKFNKDSFVGPEYITDLQNKINIVKRPNIY
jgi:hypothetical protein